MSEKTYEEEFDELSTEGNEPDEIEEGTDNSQEEANYGEVQEEAETQVDNTDYKREVEQWKHRYNSDIGRINAYQKKIQDLEQQVQRQAQPPAQSNPEGSGMTDDEWESIKEDFPEIAQAIDAKLSGLSNKYEQQIAHLQSQMAPIQQQAHEQFRSSQYQVLEQQHPDWQDIAKSTDFRQWLQYQPPVVQQLVESDSAADAAYLIGSYKTTTGQSANTDVIRQKRASQLQSARTVPNRGGRKTAEVPEDYEDAFNYFAERG